MSFSKRSDNTPVCYTKPIDSLKNWNDHFFWVDSFACPAIYPWHTAKTVFRDPPPQPTDFNANHYATLVAHPAPFWKFPEPFLCLIGTSRYYTFDQDTYPSFRDNHDEEMDLTAFIRVLDPTKVKVVEKNRAKDEPKLLDTTVGRVVPLLPVALARSEAALEASVDKLFDEGGSRNQEDSATGGDGNNIVFGADLENVAAETVVAKKPARYRKKRQAATDASGSTHPAKKLKEDYGTSGGIATSGKSPSAIKELFERSVLNVKIGVAAIATLPFVTSSIYATPKRKASDFTDVITGPNIRTIGPSERFVISLDSSHHSSNNASEAEADSIIRSVDPPVMTEVVTITDTVVVSSYLFLPVTADITSKIGPNTFLDLSFADTLKSDVAGASQRLVRRRTEYSLSKRKRLEDECGKQAGLLKSKDDEIKSLKAELLRKETEVAEAVRLRAQVAAAETAEKVRAEELDSLKQKNADVGAEKDSLIARVADLQSFISAKNLELEDANAAVTSLKSQNDSLVAQVYLLELVRLVHFSYFILFLYSWLLAGACSGIRDQIPTYEHLKEQFEEFQDVQMHMVGDKLAKLEVDLSEMALHLEEKFYPHLLTTIAGRRWLLTHGAAISRAIEKGMQDDLGLVLSMGRMVGDWRTLSLIILLRKRIIMPLCKSSVQVERIRKNIAEHRSALAGVYVPLVEPLSVQNLTGATGTSDVLPTAVATTTALSTTFASASTVLSVSVDDYIIADADNEENVQLNVEEEKQGKGEGSAAGMVEVEFEKEELGTTP
ncbi:hypothetical protein Tco_0150902 [Tanacetum coccineum]